jgi:DNA repair protein RadC
MDAHRHEESRRERLRHRSLWDGPDTLDDRETLELLLNLANPGEEHGARVQTLLQRFGNLGRVLDAPIAELRSIEGLGDSTPVALKLVRSAASLYLKQRTEGTDLGIDVSRLEALWRMRIGALPNEVFEVAYLDAARTLLRDGIERLGEGTIDRAVVYPRRVMESALRRGAACLVLAHNHPNRQVQPSEHDRLLTRALVLAGETLGVEIIDHLVVTVDSTFSFKKGGLL